MVEGQPLRILVVDDNRSAADALARLLRRAGDDVEAVYDGATAIDRIGDEPPDVVFTDLKMEPVDGMAVLHATRAQRPQVECIVFTAFGDVEIAVRAMQLGARDFLTKPVTVEQVTARIDALRTKEDAPSSSSTLIAESKPAKEMVEALKQAAEVKSRVWVEGETGSGRVFAARALHDFSTPDALFTVLDVGRDEPWPESGTVVLPNVDDLPDDLQRALARKLKRVPEDIRLVATAGPDGRAMVAAGELRPELYYELAVVVVSVPPLRERTRDIQPMFEEALNRFAGRYGRPRPTLEHQVYQDLSRHAWPGNIRELLNLAERMVVMGATADMPVTTRTTPGLPALEPGFSLSAYLEGVERRILVEALQRCGGDRAAAGRLLGVERNTLRYKLNKYGLLDK